MTYAEFELSMVRNTIKMCKKIQRAYFFSCIISIGVISINIPIILHHPENFGNSSCFGAMIYNAVWCFMEIMNNRIEIKELYRRETVYKEFIDDKYKKEESVLNNVFKSIHERTKPTEVGC